MRRGGRRRPSRARTGPRVACAAVACGIVAGGCGGADRSRGAEARGAVPAADDTGGRAPARARGISDELQGAGVVPAGTRFTVFLDRELSVESARPGLGVGATVLEPVLGPDDRILLPAGARVSGEVTALRPASSDAPAVVKLAFSELSFDGATYPIHVVIRRATPRLRDATTDGDAATTADSARGPAVASDADLAAAGDGIRRAVGTGLLLGTAGEPAVLPEGSPVELELTEAAVLRG